MKENMLCSLIFTLIFSVHFTFAFEGGDWGYGKVNGPSTWSKKYPVCGNGQKQSPIDIITKEAKHKYSLSPIHLNDYEEDLIDFYMFNDGHTVKLSSNSTKAKISGGCMKDNIYKMWQMHFHWGEVEDRGSEHQLDGKSFPMEVHFVHYNEKYKTVEEAMEKSDGLAVLGFFVEADKSDNKNYKPIVDTVRSLEFNNDHNQVKGSVTFRSLLPQDRTFYYCYDGSLTTPGCNEIVTWTVLGDAIRMSGEQLEVFRGLRDHHKKRMVDNFRPVQKLYKRAVYVRGGAEHLSYSTWLISIVTIALISRLT